MQWLTIQGNKSSTHRIEYVFVTPCRLPSNYLEIKFITRYLSRSTTEMLAQGRIVSQLLDCISHGRRITSWHHKSIFSITNVSGDITNICGYNGAFHRHCFP